RWRKMPTWSVVVASRASRPAGGSGRLSRATSSSRSHGAPRSSSRNASRARLRASRGPWSRKISAIVAHTSAASSGRTNPPRGSEPVDYVGAALDRDPAQRQLLTRGDVRDRPAGRGARLERDLAEQAHLRGRHDTVGHAHAHHEMTRGALAVKHADPLQPLGIVLAQRLPAFAGEPREILGDVEAVLVRLERLDLVHARASLA